MKSIFIKLRELNNSASSTEQAIIQYLLKNPEEALECSIHRLSEKTFSSPATILRLCRKIGFGGYKEFRLAISYELALQKQSIEEQKKEITKYDSTRDIVEKITYKNILSLECSQNLIDYETLEKAVDLLCSCRNIIFFGIGSSFFVAKDAYLKFLRIGKSCIVNDDWHAQLVQARNMTEGDLGVVLSYSGQTVEMVECMKAMKKNNVPIITITRYNQTPVSELSDCKLYVAANESLFRNGAMSSRICQLNMIDILYTCYVNHNYEYSMDRLAKTHIRKPGYTGSENLEQ